MIKYNNNTINDWNFGDDNIIKVYKHGAVCYYKITSGDTPTPVQEPCFAVVDDITQYTDTEFEDVFNKADGKWYKLNNLNAYEEYGVYGSGRTITTYEGKLTIDDGYEYIYSGGSWVNLGEVSGSTTQTVWLDYPSTNNFNANFNIGHYWGEGYRMVFNVYLSGSYSGDYGSFWRYNEHTPIEFSFYSNGFYYDFHNPTSTTSPNVYTGDNSWRIMKNGSLSSYENSQILDFTLTNGTVEVKLEETGAVIITTSTSTTSQNWYNGLYQASIGTMSSYNRCHLSSIKIYNENDELVNDLKFVKNQGVTGSQEISMYDSVLNVTYNNTNSYTPVYHVVSESGGTEYPMYYDEIQDPPNNLSFSSMAEAEAYECPWVGMNATIDGDRYVFSGNSQTGYEWVYQALPYDAEIEYLQSSGTQYINTGAYLNTSNFEVGYETADAYCLWGYCHQNVANGTWIGLECTASQSTAFFGRYGSSYMTNISSYITSGNNAIVYKQNGLTVNGNTISKNLTMGTDNIANIPLTFFARYDFYKGGMEWQNDPKFKSFYLKNNGTLVVDMIPVRVGQVGYMYDRVSGQLFGNAGTGSFILGPDK